MKFGIWPVMEVQFSMECSIRVFCAKYLFNECFIRIYQYFSAKMLLLCNGLCVPRYVSILSALGLLTHLL